MSEQTERPPGSATVAPLSGDERAELERLRAEVRTLRQAPPARKRRFDWQAFVAGLLITLGCIFAPISLATVWIHNQVANTDRFVATARPLIQDPSVQAAITDRVTGTIFDYVDVQALASQTVDALRAQGLPPGVADRLQGLTGPLASSVRGLVHDQVGRLVASPDFQAAWDQAIRIGHQQADAVLSGNASAVTISGDKVRIDLGPMIAAAKTQLVNSGFALAGRVPDVHPTITVGDASTLVKARSVYNALDAAASWLPWVTLALLAFGVYAARNHRRALVKTGFGVAAGMVVLAIALFVVRGVLVNSVPSQSAAAAGASYDILIRFLRDGLRVLLVLGLLIALGAFLSGPSPTAVRIRSALSNSVAWLHRRLTKAGLRTGRVGGWVHAHVTALRLGALAIAVLVFVFLTPPTTLALLLNVLILLFVLAVIQFLDQPAESGESAGRPPGGAETA